uniref:Tryptophan-rich sensory protein n=1 Tax=Candidatus Methanosuratincola petrocarbonis (ex Vanwonterghem et al. 2016) TaxID=1867261 RepID=A0A7J3UXP7_9CREN
MNSYLLRILNLVGFVLTVSVNALASAYALNGRTTAQVSDLYPTVVTPAGITFSIWGIIYLMLGIFVIAPFFMRQTSVDFVGKIGPLFALSCLFNIAWLLLWHYDYIAYSVFAMLALFLTLLAIYIVVGVGRLKPQFRERLVFQVPFSLYLGWITVAFVVNIAAALVYLGWDGLGLSEIQWGIVAVGLTTAITLVSVFSKRDVVYVLVILWALLGISLKPGVTPDISNAVTIGGVVLVVALAFVLLFSRIRSSKNALKAV